MIGALQIDVNNEYSVQLYSVGSYKDINWNNDESNSCDLGDGFKVFNYKKCNSPSVGDLNIELGLDGNYILRLKETKRYILKVVNRIDSQPSAILNIELLTIQNEGINKHIKCERDKDSLTFQFINYLGRSRLYFYSKFIENRWEFPFEVVPTKMSYKDDYIELTESLAERCSELLLDYAGSTSNLFKQSVDSSKTLLEQFIFLRRFCYSENLRGLFEEIKRNPDRLLIDSTEFKPYGSGTISKKVFTNPFSYTKNWEMSNCKGQYSYYPSIVAVSHKKDSVDTVANQFIKYALECFHNICEKLINELDKDGASKQIECLIEAKSIYSMLDDVLSDSFFSDIGHLNVMPQNNQVLQKRAGYAEIFKAYSMLDLALQLNWEGASTVFEGESKNVALLYEYWLFFELDRIIKSIKGCEVIPISNGFLSDETGNLTISLKEGEMSRQAFELKELKCKINLYYNRTFSYKKFSTTEYEGSYSRPFRPDYTIAIFPNSYQNQTDNGESKAIIDGAVSYIHFDAKYRVTSVENFIGKDITNSEEELEEIISEKADEINNTYKRGDLLKMHTYNDAIRRTIGSYVLYPGSDTKKFELYDELLPGVGAFAIKPSTSEASENSLRKFITQLIQEKTKINTRLNRLKYYSEMVLQEPSINGNNSAAHITESCVIGYLRDEYYQFLMANGHLQKEAEFIFYYYAIKDNFVYSHHPNIARAGLFRFYINDINQSSGYEIEPYLCEITSSELISKADLVEKLNIMKYETTQDAHSADFYYVLHVKVIDDSFPSEAISIHDINSTNGNDSFTPHSPKIIII